MADHFYDWVSVATPSYSNFDLSYAKYFTTDFFRMIPVCCEECYPGDKWTIGNRIVVRFQPMFAPVMADISVRVHYFFVPYRLLWSRDLQIPVSREIDNQDPQTGFTHYGCSLDAAGVNHVGNVLSLNGTWSEFFRGVVTLSGGNVQDVDFLQPRAVPISETQILKGTLWDYLGFPTSGDNGDFSVSALASDFPSSALAVVQDADYDNFPTVYPFSAYNMIFNEYYRDENYRTFRFLNAYTVADCAYAKDYFTSALPFQQKGEPIALPVSTQVGDWSIKLGTIDGYNGASGDLLGRGVSSGNFYETISPGENWYRALMNPYTGKDMTGGSLLGARGSKDDGSKYTSLNLPLTSSTFDVADLRFAFQIEKFLERGARGGTRLTEFLRVHYGVSPRDERLQRPEYIGGTRQPIIVSEVLQTGATEAGSPQGTMAGHAISVDSGFAGSYYVREPGLIMGIMSIVPKAHYQQGIDRAWLRRSRYDYYFPEFQNLSEQGVERGELYFSGVKADDETIIGYQGRFNEMRTRTDKVCGDFRDTLDYWHLGRKFASAPAINHSFIYGSSEDTKRIFAVQDEDPILVSFGNLLRARRPLVKYPEPGLIDHH